jgi:hypothetical protein
MIRHDVPADIDSGAWPGSDLARPWGQDSLTAALRVLMTAGDADAGLRDYGNAVSGLSATPWSIRGSEPSAAESPAMRRW